MYSVPIIDADRHVVESQAMWRDYLPHAFHRYIPYLTSTDARSGQSASLPHYMIDGKPLLYKWNDNQRIQREASARSKDCLAQLTAATFPATQLLSMDEQGIHAAYLFPTYATFIVNNEQLSARVSHAFASAYNHWLNEYCQHDPVRLKGVGVISRHDPKTMVSQLRNVNEYGWRSVILRPEKLFNRTLGHADYELFWTACEEMGIAIALHGGTHLHAPTIGTDRFESHFALHACAHPMEIQAAFLSLLEAGVLERHPALKFGFLEAGASWVPHWLWRLDEVCYASMPGELADEIKMKPSAYFKRQCWVGFEAHEPCLREVINAVGAQCLLFGSDYPHPDHSHFDLHSLFTEDAGFDEQEREMIMYQNARRFYEC